ncbi:MAG: glycosyltransferase family 2 protein [Gammaproteobacteria bacterium]
MTEKITIGMPVYNGARWVRQAIESILAQTYPKFELIISDNASTDDTAAICREYASRDARIKYRRNPENIGASDNYNAVVRVASGAYFKWASSNDVCEPTFLARCVEILDRDSDVVLCYPRTVLFNDDTDSVEYYQDDLHLMDDEPFARFKRLMHSMRLNNAMNGLIRTDALSKTALVKVYFSSDVVMMAELALHGKFFELPEFLYRRRMDKDTTTNLKAPDQLLEHYHPKRDRRMLFQQWKLIAGYFGAVHRSPVGLAQKRKCYAHLLTHCAWSRKKLFNDVAYAVRVIARDMGIMRGRQHAH